MPSQHAQRPPAQHYPPREETPHHPSNAGHPAPINTSSPPQHYTPYSQPPGPTPQSPSYAQPPGQGRPQSTYGAQELATSVYDSPIQPNPHNLNNPNSWGSSVYSPEESGPNDNPSAPPSGPYAQQPPYQGYNPDQGAPPVPTGQPPQPPQDSMTPAPLQPGPLQPGGAAYDARQGLPSQAGAASGGPGAPQPQYKPYVPPASIEGPNAPAPSDYYRSGVY